MDEKTQKELVQIADDLADLERRQHENSIKMGKLSEEMAVIKAQTLVDIAQEQDTRGKPRFSNQKIRDAELTLRLHRNTQYQKLKDDYSELYNDNQSIYIERKRLQERRNILTPGPFDLFR